MGIKDTLAINTLIKKFSTDIDDTFQYHFKCTDISDFELKLRFQAKSKILDKTFTQLSKVLSRTHNKFSRLKTADSTYVDKFEIPAEMYNRVHTAVKRNINQVAKEIQKDKIIIIRTQVNKCVFEKEDNNLNIIVNVGGQYGTKN